MKNELVKKQYIRKDQVATCLREMSKEFGNVGANGAYRAAHEFKMRLIMLIVSDLFSFQLSINPTEEDWDRLIRSIT